MGTRWHGRWARCLGHDTNHTLQDLWALSSAYVKVVRQSNAPQHHSIHNTLISGINCPLPWHHGNYSRFVLHILFLFTFLKVSMRFCWLAAQTVEILLFLGEGPRQMSKSCSSKKHRPLWSLNLRTLSTNVHQIPPGWPLRGDQVTSLHLWKCLTSALCCVALCGPLGKGHLPTPSVINSRVSAGSPATPIPLGRPAVHRLIVSMCRDRRQKDI